MKEIILTSSILILLLAIFRQAVRGRIAPRVQYALWLLVAARLLIPGTLFTAPVSVMGAAEDIRISIRETYPDPSEESSPPPAAEPAVRPVQPSPAVRPAGNPEAPVEILPPEIPFSRWEFIDWPDVIWKTGMAAVGSVMAASNLLFCLRLRRTRRRLNVPAAPWSGSLPVYEADGLSSPCLSGLFRPAVYLNEAAMDAEHPEHILAHEYAHYRNGDQLWSVLRGVCLVVHWYNPLVWWAAALCRRDCELACDASALRWLGEEERIDYGQTLLGMVSRGRNPAALLHIATTMTAGKRAMAERIAFIARAPRTRKVTAVLAALLACLLAACSFGGGAKKAAGTEAFPGAPALLEFPGLHWNDSVETVIETLEIGEKQILENGAQAGEEDVWCLTASGVPGFGGTADTAYFRFMRYEGSDWGLYSVRLDYPNDADFGAVREELIRQYGPGQSWHEGTYRIMNGTVLGGDWDVLALPPGTSVREVMLDSYGQETLDRRREILEQDGPHRTYWSADSSALSEEFRTLGAHWCVENAAEPVDLEEAQYFFKIQPMAQAFWTDAAPTTWTRPSSTFNQVWLDASDYVYYLQRIDRGGPASASVRLTYGSQSSYSSCIMNPEEVGRLWKLYQSFEPEGPAGQAEKRSRRVAVTFRDFRGEEMASFILDRGGLQTPDGEYMLLRNVDGMFEEFQRMSSYRDE